VDEELYRELVGTVPEIIVQADLAGNIADINDTGIIMSGYLKN
jgi:hypothetical protein